MLIKKKILFTIYQLSLGGAEKSLVNLLNAIDYEKFDVDLLIFNSKDKEYNVLLDQLDKRVNIIDPNRDLLLTMLSFKQLLKNKVGIKNIIDRFKLKLIVLKNRRKISDYVINQIKWTQVYSKRADFLSKEYDIAVGYMHSFPSYYVIDKVKAKKKILWVHTDYSFIKDGSEFDKYYFEKADKVVTISEKCVEELKKIFSNLIDKFICLYNYTPVEKIKQQGKEFYPGEFSKEKINILSIGRLTYIKGFDIAIKAAKELKKLGVNFKWVILGVGNLKEELMSQLDETIKNDLIFAGGKSNPYPYFYNCDIFVQSSRVEGKSIVIDEAKMFCKPIICTNYNTAKDQINNNENGLIVPLEDYIGIKDAIVKLINDVELKERIINNLRNEKYITIEEYEKLFLEDK